MPPKNLENEPDYIGMDFQQLFAYNGIQALITTIHQVICIYAGFLALNDHFIQHSGLSS